jgi:ABC-type bacteriocin/lantibiotic exporter with double-glycine peptidase domain
MESFTKSLILFFIILLFSISIYYFSNHESLLVGGCGQRSFESVALKLGVKVSQSKIYQKFYQSNYEVSLADIQVVAKQIGFEAISKHLNIVDLRRERPLGIVHIDGHHFVGLVGYDSQTIHIAETGYEGPPRIERWSDGDLMARWDGVILVISKPKDGTIPSVAAPKAAQKTTVVRRGD